MKSYIKNRSASPKPAKKFTTSISNDRKKVLADWISRTVPKTPNLVEEMIKSGVIPFKLLQTFCPGLNLKGYQGNPNTSQAYNNILLINNYIFSDFPNAELPSPSEVLKKGTSDCWVLVNSIFKTYQMREVSNNWSKCVEWFKSILKLYDIEVSEHSFQIQCLSGVYFACILNCYTGFKLLDISRKPSQAEAVKNLTLVFRSMKQKVFQPLSPSDFAKNLDSDLVRFTVFEVFKSFRFEVPTLPTREKVQFKSKPQLNVNTSESLISISSWESLEYSRSTIMSKDPSESKLPKSQKMNKLEIITDDSTGYSMQPGEVSYETLSADNTSYSKSTSDKMSRNEKTIAVNERRCMFIADARVRKEKITQVPSLKNIRVRSKSTEPDFLCFLITPRLLKMLEPEHGNFIFSVTLDGKNFNMKKEDFFFEWKDFELKLRGRIKVSEISGCESTGRVLYVSTFNENLVIQCLDEKESRSYAVGLNKINKPKTLFSRDVSCNELILNIR